MITLKQVKQVDCVGGLTFLAFGLDWWRSVAVVSDASISDSSHSVLVLFTLHEVRHRRRLTDDRCFLYLLPVAERRLLLKLISCDDGQHLSSINILLRLRTTAA